MVRAPAIMLRTVIVAALLPVPSLSALLTHLLSPWPLFLGGIDADSWWQANQDRLGSTDFSHWPLSPRHTGSGTFAYFTDWHDNYDFSRIGVIFVRHDTPNFIVIGGPLPSRVTRLNRE